MEQKDLFDKSRTAESVMREVIEVYKPRKMFAGFSGGRDSLAVTHWMMINFPECEVVHVNTGIGIERTREYVREVCKKFNWPLTEVRAKEDCGQDYRELVLKWGFPGPGGHTLMYNRLKERAIKKLVKWNKKEWKDRVVLATGLRRDESWRRSRYDDSVIDRSGALVWASPIYYWTRSDRDKYIEDNNLPLNPVAQELGMSGECLCGAYAHKGEKELVRIIDPETAEYIDELEKEVKEAGFEWGWEEAPNSKNKKTVKKEKKQAPSKWSEDNESLWSREDGFLIEFNGKNYQASDGSSEIRGPTGRLRTWGSLVTAIRSIDKEFPISNEVGYFCVGCEKVD